MIAQHFRVLSALYGQGEAMDFKAVAQHTGYADGVALAVLRVHESNGLVQELEHAEGVYAITPQGIAEVEAYR